ncbi:MAG: cytochrome C oxidase subunit IV family protein [Bacteroidota bacterium]
MSKVLSAVDTDRRLLRAWGLLVGLTLISLTGVLVFGHGETGLLAAAIALTASYFKARAVLDHFLDLRRAGKGWRGFFSGMLVVLLGCLLATYAVA